MEQTGDKETEHEGERYLRLLGLEHLSGREIVTARGTILARDFLDICGEHARPLLAGLESLNPDDSRYALTREALRGYISKFVTQAES